MVRERGTKQMTTDAASIILSMKDYQDDGEQK